MGVAVGDYDNDGLDDLLVTYWGDCVLYRNKGDGTFQDVSESSGISKTTRITRAGRWLRRTKLDELPQLLDVLAGTMSLVGPRPDVPRYVALYPPALRDKVLSVRPGLTDPASIEFRAESELLARAADPERTYVDEVLPAKLRIAAEYVEHATLATDLHVIGRTLKALFARG